MAATEKMLSSTPNQNLAQQQKSVLHNGSAKNRIKKKLNLTLGNEVVPKIEIELLINKNNNNGNINSSKNNRDDDSKRKTKPKQLHRKSFSFDDVYSVNRRLVEEKPENLTSWHTSDTPNVTKQGQRPPTPFPLSPITRGTRSISSLSDASFGDQVLHMSWSLDDLDVFTDIVKLNDDTFD